MIGMNTKKMRTTARFRVMAIELEITAYFLVRIKSPVTPSTLLIFAALYEKKRATRHEDVVYSSKSVNKLNGIDTVALMS